MSEEHNRDQPGFVFLRHGETEANHRQFACGGDREEPMTDSGRQQVTEAAALLRGRNFTPRMIITGDLQRTAESAEIIRSELNPAAEIVLDPDFNERHLGDWNGQSHSIVNPLMIAEKTPPNGESRAEFRSRMMRCVNRQFERLFDWPLVIGSRGNARILLDMIQDPDAAFFPNGKLLRVEIAPGGEFQVRRIERLEN